MKKIAILSSLLLLCLSFSCKNNTVNPQNPTTKNLSISGPSNFATTTFANGSDVSWVTQMEASGLKFYNSSGTQQDLFTILKGLGINSIRLRAWVNPSGGWCNTADVVAKAIRAKNAGMNIMIDF